MDNISLKWQAPEYHHYQRSTDWFWAVGIIVISITVLAFFFKNPLLGILIILATIIMISFVFREPQNIDYEINLKGISINKKLHPYITFDFFWIETRQNEPKIILKLKKELSPFIIIPLHEDDVDDVNDVLRQFIEEKEMREPTSHKIMEYLGF